MGCNVIVLMVFFDVMVGKVQVDGGIIEFGKIINVGYLFNENDEYFIGKGDFDFINWLW